MGLLTDIYNSVARFFRQQDVQAGEDASKSVAQNRLKLVLMQDRTNLTPKVLEQMRGEMIDLLSKYLEMDKDLLELNFEQEGDQVALMLSIPVIRAKDEEEIEKALAKADEKEKEDSEDEASDEEIGEREEANEAEDEETSEDEENEKAEEVVEEASEEISNKKGEIKIVEEEVQEEEEPKADKE